LALAAPELLCAQPRRKARIGVLCQDPRTDPAVEGMFTRLAELGWSEIRNLSVEYIRFDAATSDFRPMIDALLRARCELVVALGTPPALAVKAAAPSMPMVFVVGGDPVTLGLVASLARPGGNATGLTHASHEHHSKLLALLREVVPSGRRFAVMFEAGNPSMLQGFETIRRYAEPAGLTLRAFPLRDSRDIDAADLALTREPADGLVVFNDRVTGYDSAAIVRLAGRRSLPAAYGGRHFVDSGGLIWYGNNWAAQLARTADYLARILDGARPADLPVERPTRFDLVVNLRAARVQGINLPQSLLLQATEVIR
jgi:putative ABC transport system substrate-binding protein